MSLESTGLVGFTTGKMSVLMSLGMGTVLATEIGDPVLMPWATMGVGGVLASVIFYFYRKLVDETARRDREIAAAIAKREREVADAAHEAAQAYRVQAALLIATLQENSKVTAQLSGVVADLRTVVSESSREQRERYDQDLRDAAAGRRNYDPPIPRDKA